MAQPCGLSASMRLLLPIHRPLSAVITHARKRHNNTHDISHVETIIVTSMQTDRQSISGVCHEWLNSAIHGLRGMSAHHEQHIRPHGNFMYSGVLWCLHPWCLSSIMNTSSMNDESSLVNPLSFPLDCQRINCGSLVLVARWRTAAFSQFCSLFALPYIKRAIASL